jgi:hypothetical protein
VTINLKKPENDVEVTWIPDNGAVFKSTNEVILILMAFVNNLYICDLLCLCLDIIHCVFIVFNYAFPLSLDE